MKQINNYTTVFFPLFNDKSDMFIAVRAFEEEGESRLLVVNPRTFKTSIIDPYEGRYRSDSALKSDEYKYSCFTSQNYIKLLEYFKTQDLDDRDFGLKNSASSSNINYLTIDMCPTNKPFEREFFEYLIQRARADQQRIPIGVAISGAWIWGHKDEFTWLTAQQDDLDITWINHSMSHIYFSDIEDGNSNFLNIPNVDIRAEVLHTEKLLLQHGQIPSVFFRFPGLASNAHNNRAILDMGIIPLSADAWIYKGQNPKSGSIILVHGNSCEHDGITKLMGMMNHRDVNFEMNFESISKGAVDFVKHGLHL